MPPETFHQVSLRTPACTVVQSFVLSARAHPGANVACYTSHPAYHCQCVSLVWRPCKCFAGTPAYSRHQQPSSGRVPLLLPIKPCLTWLQRNNESQGLLKTCLLGFPMTTLLHRQSAGTIKTDQRCLLCSECCIYFLSVSEQSYVTATVWSFSSAVSEESYVTATVWSFSLAACEQSCALSSGVESE